jgi:hypothetical protein
MLSGLNIVLIGGVEVLLVLYVLRRRTRLVARVTIASLGVDTGNSAQHEPGPIRWSILRRLRIGSRECCLGDVRVCGSVTLRAALRDVLAVERRVVMQFSNGHGSLSYG